MPRAWMWAQLLIAWLPLWMMFSAMIVVMHGNTVGEAMVGSGRMIAPGALLGIVVYRFAARLPWPHPFRMRFIALHACAAAIYGSLWYLCILSIDAVVTGHWRWVVGPGYMPFLVTGVWLYVVVASSAYAVLEAQRAAQMEANATRAQLDTLRTQLHPHFLFNALHTVVQLIPVDARAATAAAEQLAGALRTTMAEQRDLVPLRDEWAFVQRYLGIESLRFGERLILDASIDERALSAMLPSFALQTLVENALRHGAAPRIEATRVAIRAQLDGDALHITVADDGTGADADALAQSKGTGLARLRERMRRLYGERARLDIAATPGTGFSARLVLPQANVSAIDDDV